MPRAKNANAGEVFTEYHKSGSVCAKGRKLDGVLHGYWEWFRKDETIKRSGNFDRGVQVGVWTTYDAKGDVYKVTTIKTHIERFSGRYSDPPAPRPTENGGLPCEDVAFLQRTAHETVQRSACLPATTSHTRDGLRPPC